MLGPSAAGSILLRSSKKGLTTKWNLIIPDMLCGVYPRRRLLHPLLGGQEFCIHHKQRI